MLWGELDSVSSFFKQVLSDAPPSWALEPRKGILLAAKRFWRSSGFAFQLSFRAIGKGQKVIHANIKKRLINWDCGMHSAVFPLASNRFCHLSRRLGLSSQESGLFFARTGSGAAAALRFILGHGRRP